MNVRGCVFRDVAHVVNDAFVVVSVVIGVVVVDVIVEKPTVASPPGHVGRCREELK